MEKGNRLDMKNGHENTTVSSTYNSVAIGRRLYELRKKSGLSLMNVAYDLDIHRDTLSYYESNPSNMKLSMLFRLADYYQVSVSYILFGDDSSNNECLILSHDTFIAWGTELLNKYLKEVK